MADDKKLADLEDELSTRKSVEKRGLKIYKEVEKGFQDERVRADQNCDFWDVYNLELNYSQRYNGTSKTYLPLVHDAVEARVTRFVNQVFPSNGRYVEVTTQNGDVPYAHAALIENYIKKAKLRTQVIPAMIRNGDVEGQYTIYATWKKDKRTVRYREKDPMQLNGMEGMDLGDDLGDKVDNVKEEELENGYTHVETINDSDICILPATADSIEDALAKGGSVTLVMRMSKGEVQNNIDDGTFKKDKGEMLLKGFTSNSLSGRFKNPRKENAAAAGIKTHGASKFALI